MILFMFFVKIVTFKLPKMVIFMRPFEQTLGDGERQGNLACFSLWGSRELDTTERLNSNNA